MDPVIVLRECIGEMSEPEAKTPKYHPFAARQTAESPVALDDVHKQQLKALKKMSKEGPSKFSIPECEENKSDPPAEESKLPPIGEDNDEESDSHSTCPPLQQRDSNSTSSESFDERFIDNWKDVKQPQIQESEQVATDDGGKMPDHLGTTQKPGLHHW